ncbi:homeobox protein VENTX [Sciurus carolinensis]|uniref:homeobox protein VENTX n=1 Tax=Sciurus carolinensis TaxID=30640 RepID=UPI001FB2CCE8|nr:homeobox protein VENTX [Sciurus carolinensis]
MPPSSLPGGFKLSPGFGSVDWLSQSSYSVPTVTSRPAEVSWARLPGPGQASSIQENHFSDQPLPEPVAAFTSEQPSALEGTFQHHQYLGPLGQRRLAQEVRLSEAQNRRMKHKRQAQDSLLNVPLPGPPPRALVWGLQLQCPWTAWPEPRALVLPLAASGVSAPWNKLP